jgi:hypothetical protein
MVFGWSLVLSDLVTYASGGGVAVAGLHSMFASGVVLATAAATHMPGLWPSIPTHVAVIVAVMTWPAQSAVFVMIALLVDVTLFVRAFRRHAARARAT